MQKFTFEFKTTSGGPASSHHYSIFGATEADARDNLVAQLGEIVTAAKALSVSDVRPAGADGAAAPEGDPVATKKAAAAARARASRAAKKAAAAPKGKAGK